MKVAVVTPSHEKSEICSVRNSGSSTKSAIKTRAGARYRYATRRGSPGGAARVVRRRVAPIGRVPFARAAGGVTVSSSVCLGPVGLNRPGQIIRGFLAAEDSLDAREERVAQ